MFLILGSGVAEMANRSKRYPVATQLFGDSGNAWSRLATAYITAKDADAATASADKALDKSLNHVRALRVLGLQAAEDGDTELARKLFRLNGKLSWRDSITHAWLFEQELIQGNYDVAMQHAESLLRRGKQDQRIFQILTLAMASDELAGPITQQFEKDSNWRTRFFAAAGQMEPTQYPGFRKLVAELRKGDAPASRDELLPFANAVMNKESPARAVAEWERNFETDSGGKSTAGAWPRAAQLSRPYPTDWRLARSRNLRSTVLADGSLEVQTSEGARGDIAWKYLVPESRPITVWLGSIEGNDEIVGALRVAARCLPDGEKIYFDRAAGNVWRARLPQACDLYRLSVDLPLGGVNRQHTIRIPPPSVSK